MENNYTVYKHTFPNNKVYIGITMQNIKRRWRFNGSGYSKSQVKIYSAIQKYGWENVKHEILYENLTKEEAEKKEIQLIKKYNSTDDFFGYNIENGGNHQGKVSDKTKQKLSKIFKGKKMGEQARINLIKNIPKKKVYQFDKNGKLLSEYISIREAGRKTNIDSGSITFCCEKKENHKTAGGYIWSYKKEINTNDYIDNKKRKVNQLNSNNKIVDTFDSIKEAADCCHIKKSSMFKRVKSGKMYDGYYWRYANE